MKNIFFEMQSITCDELSKLLGVKVNEIQYGDVPTGEFIETIMPEGEKIKIPVTQRGIIIDTKDELSTVNKNKLKDIFPKVIIK